MVKFLKEKKKKQMEGRREGKKERNKKENLLGDGDSLNCEQLSTLV